ncbi:hypothetical protein ACHAXT_002688 [Thalassiosira profunda]
MSDTPGSGNCGGGPQRRRIVRARRPPASLSPCPSAPPPPAAAGALSDVGEDRPSQEATGPAPDEAKERDWMLFAADAERRIPDEVLFREPEREECPLCFLPMPEEQLTSYQDCCGQVVCDGCTFGMTVATLERKGDVEGDACPFCREPVCCPDGERLERLKRWMKMGDGKAFRRMAFAYANGTYGLPTSQTKALEMHLRAGELGCAAGYHSAANAYFYGQGVEVDEEKGVLYWELAAMGGFAAARGMLGGIEAALGDTERAMRHCMIGVKSGSQNSLEVVKKLYMNGQVAKEEYAMALRAYQTHREETRSETREGYASAMRAYGYDA